MVRSNTILGSGLQDGLLAREAADWREAEVPLLSGVADYSMTAAILLIDDNAVQAATRQTILKRAGYYVIAAMSPARALEQFRDGEFPEEIGLVITDHLMPEMTGAKFVRALRVTHPVLPVMVISGLEEAETEYDGMDVAFRLKPVMPENLLACVHGLMGRSGSGTVAIPVR